MIGRQLANYRIVDEIGRGGMGAVYLAEDKRLDRQVALKLLPPEFGPGSTRFQRFQREAQLLAKLDHSGIVTVHSIEECDGMSFITMQLVRGESLDRCIPKGGLPIERLLDVALRLADAMAAAHEAGIMHRDIKPSNIMLADNDQVKILDFGLAKSLDASRAGTDSQLITADVESTLTASGGVVGTLPYLAPEQLAGQPGDERSDLFALGAVLYEMATGRRPFEGALRTEPPDATRLRPDLPRWLERTIRRCLVVDPAERWQSADGLLAELERLGGRRVGRQPDPRGAHAASVAILPLVDHSSSDSMTSPAEKNWFADGLTEALITGLARLGSLRVIASGSTLGYRDQPLDASRVGRELGVDYVLHGTVLGSAGRVRVTARLVDADTETVVWAGEYTEEVEDVLSVQGHVAQAVAREIKLQLSPDERRRLGGRVRVSQEALHEYLFGRHHWNKRYEGGLQRAIEHFQRALELEPTYGPAYSGLADCYIVLGWYAFLPPEKAFGAARQAAGRALDIDPDLPEALTSLGGVTHLYDWDPEQAERYYQRALELNPSYAHCRWWYSFLLMSHGRAEESWEQSRAAIALDPLSLHIKATAGWMRMLDGHYEQAEALLKESLEIDAGFALTNIFLGWLHEHRGQYDAAMQSWSAALAKLTMQSLRLQAAHTQALSGDSEGARKTLLQVEEGLGTYWVSPCQRAVARLALGERDEALGLVRKAREVRDPWVLTLALDRRFDALRDDAEFTDLVESVVAGRAVRGRGPKQSTEG